MAWGLVSKIASAVADVEWVSLYPQAPASTEDRRLDALGVSRPQRLATARTLYRRGHALRSADDLIDAGTHSLVEGPSRLLDTWTQGTDRMSAWDIRFTLAANYLLAGGAYLIIGSRAPTGRPVDLYPFPIQKVRSSKGSRFDTNQNQRFFAEDGDLSLRNLTKSDVWLWRAIDPASPYASVAGLGGAIATELGIDEQSAQITARRFSNNGTPPGIFIAKGAAEDRLEELRDTYGERSNIEDVSRPLWVNDDVDYKQIGETLADMGLESLRDSTRKRIRQTPGVPPEIMGDVEDSNRATSHEARRIMARNVVEPILRSMSDFVNRWLPGQVGSEEVLSYVDPMPEDIQGKEKLLETVPEIVRVGDALSVGGFAPYGDERDDMPIGEFRQVFAAESSELGVIPDPIDIPDEDDNDPDGLGPDDPDSDFED